MTRLQGEIARRRTFAIISHPDAGKTALTEKLLLFGGDLGPIIEFHISTFDDPDGLVPEAHAFYPERLPWMDTADSLPRHEGFTEDSPVLRHGPAEEGLPGG